MCFRLYAAVRGPPEPGALEQLGFRCGLDVRVASNDRTRFVEVAWGDCACSLYTRSEGRERVVRFVDGLLGQGVAVQLLLLRDEEAADWASRPPAEVSAEAFRATALAALPEGRVTQLR
ncbi:MAG TPA: hypothetical protein VH208_05050 [Myxococcaceae bacterium]|nr:hypothetical protein [Myxococcaceae bacterium]